MQDTTDTPKKYNRVRLGINPMTLSEGQTRMLEILSDKIETFEKKDGDHIDYVLVRDMDTNEEGHFWLGGQARYQIGQLEEHRSMLKGIKLDITHKGKASVSVVIEGRLTEKEVNQYDIFELQ